MTITVCKGEEDILKGKRINIIYYVYAKTVIGQVDVSKEVDSKFWHTRIGHINQRGLNGLKKQDLIKFDKEEDLSNFKECISSKSKKLPYNLSHNRSHQPLEYIRRRGKP